MLLRAKLDDTLDIIRSRKLKLSNGQLIQDAATQEKNGTNYIINYNLYVNGILISRPIFSNIVISKVLYSKNNIIQSLIERFIINLKERFNEKSLICFFDYVLSRTTVKYKEKFIKRVFKNGIHS